MLKRLPFILFVAALVLGAFFAGMWVWQTRVFPYHLAHSAHKTLRVALEMRNFIASGDRDKLVAAARRVALENAPEGESNKLNTADLLECDRSEAAKKTRRKLRSEKFKQLGCLTARVASREASAKRIEFIVADRLHDPVLVGGGVGMFLEHCPPPPHSGLSGGCLAVEYSRNGEVSRAVPFRPQAIEAANIVSEEDYLSEHPPGWVFWRNVNVVSVAPYPDGDLLVTFRLAHTFPYGGGAARVARDGHPRWFRKDYSHHWPHIVDDQLALVPGGRMEWGNNVLPMRVGHLKKDITCHRDQKWMVDTVNLIDGKGRLLEEIDILGALLESPYNGIFLLQLRQCDVTHLNFAHQLGADAGGADSIAPGDIVASLRSLSAFGIIDRDTRRLKRLVRGSFVNQHAVRHFEKARFLMFDNLGTDGVHGPSRLLMVDLATGKETTLFPRDHTPTHLRRVTAVNGHIEVSPDRQRVLFNEKTHGRILELRLSDGRVLNIFRQLHDLSSVDAIPDPFRQRAWVFQSGASSYANQWSDHPSTVSFSSTLTARSPSATETKTRPP